MEPSAPPPEDDGATNTEIVNDTEVAVTIYHVEVWLHIATRRARKTHVIEQTLKQLVDCELQSTDVEVHWLESQTLQSTCSPAHRHSDTDVTFEYAGDSETSQKLEIELRAIAQSLYATSGAIVAFDVRVTEP